VFVNGALAVPGAPANTDTVPAKFSEKNAKDDKLVTLAYTFKLLTDEQRRAIYEGLKGQEAGPAFNADVGVELPSSIELRPVPNDVAARVPQTKDYRYAVAENRVLLVAPVGRFVVGLFMDDVAANFGVPPWLNASASMASSGQIQPGGLIDTGPATIAAT
jgi:hypothetical protein